MKYILIVLILLHVNIFADEHEYEEYHAKRHISKELSHLQLTKEQKREIKKILKEYRYALKEYRELKEEIEEKREMLFLKERFNTKKLNRLNGILDEKAHKIENDFLSKIHSVLNREQRKRFIYYFDDWEVK